MLKVLDEKYTYEQLDKELCKNGYKIIDKLNYNCNRFNFFSLKRWSDSYWHGYFELEYKCSKEHADFMGVKYNSDNIQMLNGYLCYPYKQAYDGMFKIVTYISPMIKHKSLINNFDINEYSKYYYKIDIVYQDNDVLEYFLYPYIESQEKADDETNNYEFCKIKNMSRLMNGEQSLFTIESFLKKYDYIIFCHYGNDIINAYNSILNEIKDSSIYNNKKWYELPTFINIMFGNEKCYLDLYVQFNKEGVEIRNIRYVNNIVKMEKFLENKYKQLVKNIDKMDELKTLLGL